MVQIAHGWNVRMGYVNVPPPARLLYVPANYWPGDGGPGVAGFQLVNSIYDVYDDSKFCLGKFIEWLTGKTSGATILLFDLDGDGTGSGNFEYYFRLALAELGHSVTTTNSTSNENGYDPLNFDCSIHGNDWNAGATYHGIASSQSNTKLEYVLDNGGHLLLRCYSGFKPALLSDRGLEQAGWHSTHTPRQRLCTGGTVYPGGTLKLSFGTTQYIYAGTNTVGGTEGIDFCDTHGTQGCWGWWEE